MNYETLTPEEKWNQAGLSNNFIFYKVFRNNPEECKKLLEILLGIKIRKLVMSQEESIFPDPTSKGIRMDLYIQSKNECIDLEMQTIDTKELPERARYYQSVMDVDTLKSGKTYSELKTSYIVFLCLTDIFHKGLPVYTFENLCLEDTNLHLNDRSYKYFYICANGDKINDVEQKNFFRLITTGKAEDTFTKRLSRLIEDAKHNTQWRMQFMEYERQRTYDRLAGYEKGLKAGIEQGIAQGITQGIETKAIDAAKSFLKEGIDAETIAKCVGLPVEKVQELQAQL